MELDNNSSITINNDAKLAFKKLGTCSRTFFYLLNREFGQLNEVRERAADPLSGGILRKGHQCGMLWGSSLAVGAEAYRSCESTDQAIEVAINATQEVMNSFSEKENTIHCKDITHCDFKNKWSFAKYLLSGRFLYCFKMAQEWAPDAVRSAKRGLNIENVQTSKSLSCASEVANKSGASEEEIVMVAGFAGGLGLSGSGCGALAASIWLNSVKWLNEKPEKPAYNNPYADKSMETFKKFCGDKINCREICGKSFNSVEEHSNYILNGGCSELIDLLVSTAEKSQGR